MFDVVVYCINICLVYQYIFFGEVVGVVDWVFLIFGMFVLVFIQNKKKFLGFVEGKNGYQNMVIFVENVCDGFYEGLFFF